ncbi:MAG: hypothetical protein JWQ09_2869 [Segetibacter sp.]|nr:hypothetical protein [Segetibacter sp.]
MLLHINNITQLNSPFFNNRFLINVLKSFKDLIEKLKINYHTGIIRRLNERLERQYINIVGITSILENECEEINAEVVLSEVRSAIASIRETHELLESVNFFNFSPIREMSEKILDAIYNLEFILRKMAFKNKKPSTTSPEAEVTSRLQEQALSM